MRKIIAAALCGVLTSCAASSAMRTSQDTIVIKTRAAPICGQRGAMRVSGKQAAVETIKAGYDRYVILGEAGASTVQVSQLPGSYNTVGSGQVYGNTGTFQATTTYSPGPTIVTGGHHENLAVKMFRNGDPAASSALSARETLGPKWQEIVRDGINTCAD